MTNLTELRLRNVLLRKACLEELNQEDYDKVIEKYKESLKARGMEHGYSD